MMQASLRQVAAWSGSLSFPSEPEAGDLRVAGVSTDTRTLAAGQLFVPLAGERFDGHDHLAAAEAAGAAAALWQADRPLPDTRLPLIVVADTLAALQRLAASYLASIGAKAVGVTGSNGKTTTKDLVASVLSTGYKVTKTEGNFNNHIGLPLTILRAPADTEVLVLEMGMSGRGEIALLTRIAKPVVAIITNIGESHLLQLGSRRNIARAKLEIAEGLQPGGTLVYNGDEPLLAEELAAAPLPEGTRAVTFGQGEGCALRLGRLEGTAQGSRFTVADDPDTEYELPVPGRHNALNALAAVAIGRLFGLSAGRIAEGLRTAKLTGMRIERTTARSGATVLNDAYNASPTSMRAAIDLLGGLAPEAGGRKYLVIGDMLELGPEEAAFHAGIGRYATPDKTDFLFAYGPLSLHAVREAERVFPPGAVRHFADKRELIGELLARLGPADLALVKASRGMKLEEVVFALQRGAVE
ncbi:UDP-N-acetylmuramoyl-tripeptide--D-alanyl-D-alanine ligase [Cohnella thermotolerans]|uniref:UDP-N-acetylmuramoyl-tripeptide--D-alanyl-D- alanine ligase n=1 Tax=Cohnella thermotolerans TaxID=329858 RepID=UPI00047DBC32